VQAVDRYGNKRIGSISFTPGNVIASHPGSFHFGPLRAVYTRVFSVRFSVRNGAAAQQLPLLFAYVIAREKQRKQLGSGAIADGETDAKNASVDGP
jgi:hypothetical protein